MDHTSHIFSKTNLRWLSVLFVILSVFFFFKILQTIKDYRNSPTGMNQISVSAVGEAYAVPNIAEISFSIEKESKIVKESQDFVNIKTKEVLDMLKSKKIDDKDIKTTNDSFSPQYDYLQTNCTMYSCPPSTPTIRGYLASRSFSVKIRNVDNVGDISQSLGNLSVTNLNGPSFVLDDEEAIKVLARTDAINKARAKADQIAKDLGVKIKKVVTFYEEQSYNATPMMAKSADVSMSSESQAPILPTGENKYTVSVTVTYEIR